MFLLASPAAANPPLGIAAELPDWVIARLKVFMNDKEIVALGRSMMNPAPLDLRVNTVKGKRDAVMAQLRKGGIVCTATYRIRRHAHPEFRRRECLPAARARATHRVCTRQHANSAVRAI